MVVHLTVKEMWDTQFKAQDVFKTTGVLKILQFGFHIYNRLMWEDPWNVNFLSREWLGKPDCIGSEALGRANENIPSSGSFI